jgi:hypothetical protein
MSYALYLDDQKISGPFLEESEAWADATKRGLVTVIPSQDEDPPRRILNLNYSIRSVVNRTAPEVSAFENHTNGIAPDATVAS